MLRAMSSIAYEPIVMMFRLEIKTEVFTAQYQKTPSTQEKQKADIQSLGDETCYFYKRSCVIDEKAENWKVTQEVLLVCCQERLNKKPRAQGALLGSFWWSSQLLIRIPQERKELISKAYFDVVCARINLELLLVSRLGDNVLETDWLIFRLTYGMVEMYLKYITSPHSNCKKP